MHRRHRHLNARDAGATMVLDARFISGNDGDAIGTWSSRTSSTYDMTQATSGKRPLLRLGANGMNGQATVTFDGSDDMMEGVNESLTNFTIVYTAQNTGSSTTRVVFGHVSSTNYAEYPYCYIFTNNRYRVVTSNNVTFLPAENTDSSTGAHVVSNTFDQTTLRISVDGNADGTSTPSYSTITNNKWSIGAGNEFGAPNGVLFFNSKLSAISVFKSVKVSDPLRKRLNHSQAYSFKIACS